MKISPHSPKNQAFRQVSATLAIGLSLLCLVVTVHTEAAEELETVTLQLKWMHQFQFAGYYAAQEKGFYQQEGLNVILKERDVEVNNIRQVLDGAAEYGVADSVLLLYRLRGDPVVLVSPIFQHSPMVYMTLRSSGIDSPYHIKGKRVMVYTNDTDGLPLAGMLSELGISREDFMPVTQISDPSVLENGEIDVYPGYLANESYYFYEKDIAFNIIDPKNYGVDFYGDMLFTSAAELHEHPERVERFRRASLAGWEYALEHPEEIIDLLIQRYGVSKSREHLRYEAGIIRRMIDPDYVELGKLDIGRLRYTVNTLHRLGLVESETLPEDFYAAAASQGAAGLPQARPEPSQASIALTVEEQAFLDAHPVIRVHNEQAWEPFNFAENGRPMGFSIDYMNLLAEKLGITVEYVTGPSWNEFLTMMQERTLDMMLNIVMTEERKAYIRFSREPYLETPRAIVTRSDDDSITGIQDLDGKTVAVEKGFFYETYLSENHPQINLLPVENTLETLRAVVHGQADATLGVIAVQQYLINKHFFTNLKFVFAPNELALRSFDQYIGVRGDWPLLASCIDKAMAAVTLEERLTLSERWIKGKIPEQQQIQLTPDELTFIREHPVIRVQNENDYPPYDFLENGEPQGFSIDYLQLIAEKTGLNFEFVSGYSWTQILEHIEARELDVIHTCTETEVRRQFATFTTPYITPTYSLIKPSGSPIQSLSDLTGKRLAVLKGTMFIPELQAQFPEIELVEYENTADVLRSILFGDSEAAVETLQLANYVMKRESLTNLTFRRVDELAQAIPSWRIGVRSDWPELHAIIQKGMNAVTNEEMNRLSSRWFGMVPDSASFSAPERASLVLTPEERAYLDTHPVVRVAFDIDWPPVEFADKDTGMDGISADYLAYISSLLGIEFEPAPPMSWQEMLTAVEEGELDMFSALMPTSQRAEWLSFTDTYLSFPIVIVTTTDIPYIGSLDELAGKTVAVVNGYATDDLLSANHPAVTLLSANNVRDALMNVIEGNAFAFIGSLPTVSHVMAREGLSTLKVSGETPYSYQLAMAARKENAVLVRLLQKALTAIPQQERNAIHNNWFRVTIERLTDYSLVWRVSAVAFAIVVVVLFWNRRLTQMTHALNSARKQAEQANIAKSTFLANMSHELRTPLNAVLGYAQILARSHTLSAEDKGHLTTISRSGEHLLALINDVLELSKIDANRVELQPVRFDLHQLLADLEAMFRLRAERKGLALQVEYTSEVPPVILADQGKLRQVLINLLGNAVKYTEHGGVTLSVETHGRASLLHFQISDTGIGIAPGNLEKIFNAFVRVDEQQYNTGTGLGLPISRKYIRMMGGDIRVKSDMGNGSTFTFDIPVECVTQAPPITPCVTGPKRIVGIEPDRQSAEGSPYRILIVDDDGDNCDLLLHLLEPTGFQVRVAHNGEEALALWKSWQPHLIWMDMRMPVMNGYEATRRIRAAEAAQYQSHIPIIALTASAFEEDREHVLEAGCDDFVRKPFQHDEIFEMLHTYLGVRFLYETSTPCKPKSASTSENALTPEALAALPAECLAILEQGAKETNTTLLFEGISRIQQHDADIAEALALLVGDFEYDTILTLIQPTEHSI